MTTPPAAAQPATDVTLHEAREAITVLDMDFVYDRLGVDMFDAGDRHTEREACRYITGVILSHLRRNPDPEVPADQVDEWAYTKVMGLTRRGLLNFFAPSTDLDPDDPDGDSPSGKDGLQPADAPTS